MRQIAVIDGMGGGLGTQVVSQLRPPLEQVPGTELVALGSNAAATGRMVRAGAARGATGHNAICFSAPRAHIIIGPLGIIIPHGMMGEITPEMAAAVVASPARKFLLPVSQPHVELIGIREAPLAELLRDTVARVLEVLELEVLEREV